MSRPSSTPGAKPRVPGRWAGKMWMADDFDDTPEAVIDAFEGFESTDE